MTFGAQRGSDRKVFEVWTSGSAQIRILTFLCRLWGENLNDQITDM